MQSITTLTPLATINPVRDCVGLRNFTRGDWVSKMDQGSGESAYHHIPVLAGVVADLLVTKAHGTFVDCTYGRGGHSRLILEQLDAKSKVIGIDCDPEAELDAQSLAKQDPRFSFVRGRFSDVRSILDGLSVDTVDGVLLDVGVSTPQIASSERGFSFDRDGDLDMRMDPTADVSAAEWLNTANVHEIAGVLRNFGEVHDSFQLAKTLVQNKPIETTGQLSELVKQTLNPTKSVAQQLAKVFQAIRIQVNQELSELEEGLAAAFEVLSAGGRLVVITFHSLEHRIARRFLTRLTQDQGARGMPLREEDRARARMLKKNLRPSDWEVAANNAARSAVLYAVERVL